MAAWLATQAFFRDLPYHPPCSVLPVVCWDCEPLIFKRSESRRSGAPHNYNWWSVVSAEERHKLSNSKWRRWDNLGNFPRGTEHNREKRKRRSGCRAPLKGRAISEMAPTNCGPIEEQERSQIGYATYSAAVVGCRCFVGVFAHEV